MAKKLRRLLPIAALALFSSAAVAQSTSTITGVVTDASTGKPVVGAVVVVTSPALEAEQTAVTEVGGKYSLPGLPAGDYTLAVQFEGYKPFERADLKLKDGTTLRANAQVVPEAVQMEEVVVTGSRIRRKDLTTPAPVDGDQPRADRGQRQAHRGRLPPGAARAGRRHQHHRQQRRRRHHPDRPPEPGLPAHPGARRRSPVHRRRPRRRSAERPGRGHQLHPGGRHRAHRDPEGRRFRGVRLRRHRRRREHHHPQARQRRRAVAQQERIRPGRCRHARRQHPRGRV